PQVQVVSPRRVGGGGGPYWWASVAAIALPRAPPSRSASAACCACEPAAKAPRGPSTTRAPTASAARRSAAASCGCRPSSRRTSGMLPAAATLDRKRGFQRSRASGGAIGPREGAVDALDGAAQALRARAHAERGGHGGPPGPHALFHQEVLVAAQRRVAGGREAEPAAEHGVRSELRDQAGQVGRGIVEHPARGGDRHAARVERPALGAA